MKLADTDIEVLTGMDGLIACASESGADIVVTAVVGMVGLLPTLAAINAGFPAASCFFSSSVPSS